MAERCGNCCFTSVPNFRKIHFSLDNAVRRLTVSPGPVKLDSDLEDRRGSVNLRIQREFSGSQKVRVRRTERPIRNFDRISKFSESSAVPIIGGVSEKGSPALLSKTNLPLGRFPLYDYIYYMSGRRGLKVSFQRPGRIRSLHPAYNMLRGALRIRYNAWLKGIVCLVRVGPPPRCFLQAMAF